MTATSEQNVAKVYHKMRQVFYLKNGTLLQHAVVIAKCNNLITKRKVC